MNSATVLRRIAKSLENDPPSGGPPKYLSLHNRILSAIEVGDWMPGEKLPPETAFAQAVPVSLGTIQKALQMLADDGVVVRRHRDGTYVAGAAVADEATIFRFLADDGKSLLPIYTNVLEIAPVRASGPWSEFLGAEESFIRITRLVSINLEFDTYNQVYLSANRFSDFLDIPAHDLDGTALTRILGERYNAPMLRTVQRLRVSALPPAACQAIGCPENTIGMSWNVLAYSYRDAPVTFHQIYLPPNDRQLEVREP